MSDGKPPDILFSAAEIAARVDEIAEGIAANYGRSIIAVPILNGALIFAADLVRALWRLGVAVDIRPIRVRSYGAGQSPDKAAELVFGLDRPLDGAVAVAIDGVCDTGHTIAVALEHLRAMGAGRVGSAVVVDKPGRRTAEARPDFAGFEADDHFVIGYGMDAAGSLRHLPYIGVLRPDGTPAKDIAETA